MNELLVLNAGSSSLKYAVFDERAETILTGYFEEIGSHTTHHIMYKGEELREKCVIEDHLHAVLKACHTLTRLGVVNRLSDIKKVGHRIVHGGEEYYKPTKITKKVIENIKRLGVLAPLHNPPAVAGILAITKIIPRCAQYAVFDTSFHHTIPKEAFLYGIPYSLYERHGIRKYGFHGISHAYVAKQAKHLLGNHRREQDQIITCHLGNGSSITAIKNGLSVDTSMGFSPLDGLIMGTRSGDLDPEIIFYLLRYYSPKKLEHMLQEEAGLKGIAGVSDMRKLHEAVIKRDERARLAMNMLAYRLSKYIGSYVAVLNGLDALVFTGGIGEKAYYLRRQACKNLEHLGIILDAHENRKNSTVISTPSSKVKVLVIPTNEELAIAKQIL